MSHPGTTCSLPDNLQEEGAGNICKDTGEKVMAGRLCYLITGEKTGREMLSSRLAAAKLYLDRYTGDYISVLQSLTRQDLQIPCQQMPLGSVEQELKKGVPVS